MAIWILQGLVDLLLVNVALLWILSRKRTRFLEAQVDRLELEIEALKTQIKAFNPSAMDSFVSQNSVNRVSSIPSASTSGLARPISPAAEKFVAAPFTAPLAAPLNSPRGNLIEKRPEVSNTRPLSKTETADAYDRASQLLSRGMPIKEIARQTGLSVAELQLMGKVSNRTQ